MFIQINWQIDADRPYACGICAQLLVMKVSGADDPDANSIVDQGQEVVVQL
jgi:hypothetical protein